MMIEETTAVLVTGGCGFIGSNLVRVMLSTGNYRVIVLDNETMGSREALPPSGVEFINGDLRDPAAVDRALDGAHAVVHLAAESNVAASVAHPAICIESNIVGSFNLLEGMRKRGIPQLIQASSSATLGQTPPPINEQTVPNPLSPYGASKLAVEGLCQAYASCYGMRTISLRFANVYGPCSDHSSGVIATFCRRIRDGKPVVIYGNGEQTRDYVHVHDICNGILRSLRLGESGIYQLGTEIPTDLHELLALLEQITGRAIDVQQAPPREGEIRNSYCDISKARKSLGWSPQVALPEGLRQTWHWFAAAT